MYLPLTICSSLFFQTALTLPHHQLRNAKGFVSLPFAKKSHGIERKVRRDEFSAALKNELTGYYIDVSVGTPPQTITVLLDTGSSDVWFYSPTVNCTTCTDQYYDDTASSSAVLDDSLPPFVEDYVTPDSSISGYYVTDVLSIGGVDVEQIIGVATLAGSGDPLGGIMGVGPSIDEGIVSYEGQKPFPGYIDTLANSGVINTRAYSVFFNGQYHEDPSSGTVIFGGYDSSKWSGDLVAFPIAPPLDNGYQLLAIIGPAISLAIGDDALDLASSAVPYYVLLDTGTELTYLPSDQFQTIVTALDLEVLDNGISLVSCDLRDLEGGFTYQFSGPNGDVVIQVPWAELVFAPESDLPDGVCQFGISPDPSDLVVHTFGDTFLRSAYLLYNYDDATISLAQANYDTSTEHVKPL